MATDDKERPKSPDWPARSFVSTAWFRIGLEGVHRIRIIGSRVEFPVIGVLSLLPVISFPGVATNGGDLYVPQQANDSTTLDDVNTLVSLFDFRTWQSRAKAVREGNNRRQYFGNLCLALHAIGPLTQNEFSGALGALSLLPTAGALIGAPTKSHGSSTN